MKLNINYVKKRIYFFLYRLKHENGVNYWKNKDIDVISQYWENRNNKDNEFIFTILDKFCFNSMLEVGSNCGNRLYAIAKRYKNIRLHGIDINKSAIEFGNNKFNEELIHNVKLQCLDIKNLENELQETYDIVFSWATLIYINSSDIVDVLQSMYKKANKAVIILEINDYELKRNYKGIFVPPRNWKRNYNLLFNSIGVKEDNIVTYDIPKEVWNPGGGKGQMVIVSKDVQDE